MGQFNGCRIWGCSIQITGGYQTYGDTVYRIDKAMDFWYHVGTFTLKWALLIGEVGSKGKNNRLGTGEPLFLKSGSRFKGMFVGTWNHLW